MPIDFGLDASESSSQSFVETSLYAPFANSLMARAQHEPSHH